ncbi:MAG TPA: MarR family winged helix-turn-helix transcriptional regulator [Candidatus Acidoferrales bacterium]|nr:MarR family winged helix-turn-helix transcriptional regulator [Candidatus Acidoferrales bacterium]
MAKAGNLDLTGTGHCASFNFRRTARAITKLYDGALAETGLRSTQFAILVGIAKLQPAAISAVGEVLVIDPTTLSRSLRLMEKEGLIAIGPRSEKRQRLVSVTRRGEEALGKALPAWREMQARFETTVGAAHWKELRDELERLAGVAGELETGASL